jgi:hypothetical protein
MAKRQEAFVDPQPFEQWQRAVGASEAEPVRVREVGERRRGDEPAAHPVAAPSDLAPADAGASPAADAGPVTAQPAPRKRGGSRRRSKE